MPLPRPKPNEGQDSYISRCISFVFSEGTLRGKPVNPKNENDRKRATAACFNTWRNKAFDELRKSIDELKFELGAIKKCLK